MLVVDDRRHDMEESGVGLDRSVRRTDRPSMAQRAPRLEHVEQQIGAGPRPILRAGRDRIEQVPAMDNHRQLHAFAPLDPMTAQWRGGSVYGKGLTR